MARVNRHLLLSIVNNAIGILLTKNASKTTKTKQKYVENTLNAKNVMQRPITPNTNVSHGNVIIARRFCLMGSIDALFSRLILPKPLRKTLNRDATVFSIAKVCW